MLPGFRFLFAAIVLSMSILVFGLGAAALLRAAHEQFVSNPSWHVAPETMFAQQREATQPVLAMLHAEPAAAEREKAPDQVPAPAAPAEQATSVAVPSEPAAVAAAPAESEATAAMKTEQPSPAEVAKPEAPGSQNSSQSETAPALGKADAPGSPDPPAPAAESKIAATAQASPPATQPPPPPPAPPPPPPPPP